MLDHTEGSVESMYADGHFSCHMDRHDRLLVISGPAFHCQLLLRNREHVMEVVKSLQIANKDVSSDFKSKMVSSSQLFGVSKIHFLFVICKSERFSLLGYPRLFLWCFHLSSFLLLSLQFTERYLGKSP